MTGGNAGVGYATAEALLERGCSVVLAVRDRGRGDAAAARLVATAASGGSGRQQSGGGRRKGSGVATQGSAAAAQQQAEPGPEQQEEAARVEVELLDLASLASVRAFAEKWKASGRRLDLLVCNGEAGRWVQPGPACMRLCVGALLLAVAKVLQLLKPPASRGCLPHARRRRPSAPQQKEDSAHHLPSLARSGHHGASGAHHHRRRLRASVPGAICAGFPLQALVGCGACPQRLQALCSSRAYGASDHDAAGANMPSISFQLGPFLPHCRSPTT